MANAVKISIGGALLVAALCTGALILGIRLGATQTPAPVVTADEPARGRVELANTEVHDLPSRETGRKYQVWIDLPASYAESADDYPVVFVTDPNLWFAVVRGLARLHGQRGQNIEDFILVGLTHEEGLAPPQSRARDYTPSNPRGRAGANLSDYQSDVYGEAAAYRDYIESEVFPFIAGVYRADMERTIYMGHSYGGLFGAFVLSTKPQMFDTYLLGSPSFWFDRKAIFEIAEGGALAGAQARVMMVAGGYETPGPEPRHYKTTDLVGDMQAFAAMLEARDDAELEAIAIVMPGEDHFTVFPSLVSRGLLWALPGRGPYTSG